MGFWSWIKEKILDSSISVSELKAIFDAILKAVDENDDEQISVRELIKSIKLLVKLK